MDSHSSLSGGAICSIETFDFGFVFENSRDSGFGHWSRKRKLVHRALRNVRKLPCFCLIMSPCKFGDYRSLLTNSEKKHFALCHLVCDLLESWAGAGRKNIKIGKLKVGLNRLLVASLQVPLILSWFTRKPCREATFGSMDGGIVTKEGASTEYGM